MCLLAQDRTRHLSVPKGNLKSSQTGHGTIYGAAERNLEAVVGNDGYDSNARPANHEGVLGVAK
jgi:hypothetical protein